MGTSVQWYSKETDEPTDFPETPWAIQFTAENYQKATGGEWNWETGFGWDQIKEFEKIRDHGLRAVFGNWSFQKNHAPDKQRLRQPRIGMGGLHRRQARVAPAAGRRDPQQQDIVEQREFPDASVTTTWTIDLHYPTDFQSEHFPGKEFRSRAEHVRIEPYPIPYRCFYSRNVDNLFMAGRNISVTHVALGTVRVMRTLGMVGEVVGMAAAVCKRHDVDPRQVYTDHLDELKELMTEGVGKLPCPTRPAAGPPKWLAGRRAEPGAGGRKSVSRQLRSEAVPGQQHQRRPRQLYRQQPPLGQRTDVPDTVELVWDEPQKIGAVRIVTGQAGGAKGRRRPSPTSCCNTTTAPDTATSSHQDRRQRVDRLARPRFPPSPPTGWRPGRLAHPGQPDPHLGVRSLRTGTRQSRAQQFVVPLSVRACRNRLLDG
jgi:hypothetical protein